MCIYIYLYLYTYIYIYFCVFLSFVPDEVAVPHDGPQDEAAEMPTRVFESNVERLLGSSIAARNLTPCHHWFPRHLPRARRDQDQLPSRNHKAAVSASHGSKPLTQWKFSHGAILTRGKLSECNSPPLPYSSSVNAVDVHPFCKRTCWDRASQSARN